MFVFRKIWRALFSCYLRFENHQASMTELFFLQKYSSFDNLSCEQFSRKSSIIDIWQGSKLASEWKLYILVNHLPKGPSTKNYIPGQDNGHTKTIQNLINVKKHSRTPSDTLALTWIIAKQISLIVLLKFFCFVLFLFVFWNWTGFFLQQNNNHSEPK